MSRAERPRAVVSTISSDAHTWNLVYLQLVLEEHGFAVRNLGCCVPVEELVAGCLEVRPRLLALSTVNGHGLIEAPEYIREIRRHPELRELVVVIGGKLSVGGTLPDGDREGLLALGFDGVFPAGDHRDAFSSFLTGLGAAAAA